MTGLLYRMAGIRVLGGRPRWLGGRLPAEVPDDVAAALVRAAEAFLRAGGAVSLRAWLRLSGPERGALVAAGDRVRADLASASGFASQGPLHALAIQGVVDGGSARDRLGLEAEALRIARERAGAEVKP